MQVPWTYRGAAIAVAAFLLVTGLASSASARTLYAEPNGDGPLPCAAANPCSLTRAVAGATNRGDVVVLAFGLYNVGAQAITTNRNGITIRGARASDPVPSGNNGVETRPIVLGSAFDVLFAPGANVRWLTLFSTTRENEGTVVTATYLEDVWAYSYYENGCFTLSATNTLCRGEKIGVYVNYGSPQAATITYNLANVTAIGGTFAVSYSSDGSLNATARINSSLLSGDVAFRSLDAATTRGVLTYSRVSGDVITQGMGASWQSGIGTATGPANFPALQSFVPVDGSSAVDAGDPELFRTTDLNYNTGVVNDRIDIGAYENQTAIGGPPPPADPAQALPPGAGALIPPIVLPVNQPAATPAPVAARASVRVGRPRAQVQRRSMTTRVRVVTNKPGRIVQTVRYRQGKRNRLACRATIVASDAVTRNVSCQLNRRARALLRKKRVRFTVTTVFRAAGEAPVRNVKRFSVKRRA
jgi:hypothetical protein